jgi:hypothetical protein
MNEKNKISNASQSSITPNGQKKGDDEDFTG